MIFSLPDYHSVSFETKSDRDEVVYVLPRPVYNCVFAHAVSVKNYIFGSVKTAPVKEVL